MELLENCELYSQGKTCLVGPWRKKKYIKVIQVMLSLTGKCQEDFLLGVWGRAMHMEHQWYCCKELKKRVFLNNILFPKEEKVELWWLILMVHLTRSGIN